MTEETLFQVVNLAALSGWLMLAVSPWLPGLSDRIAGYVLPAALALVYIGLIAANAGAVEGASYTTLTGVMAIFDVPGAALGGWVHFLAFDLVVGAWIARNARAESVPFPYVVPCLVFCFLVGPVGFVMYLGLRGVARRRA